MPTPADRTVALTVSMLIGCICYAGKASVFALHAITLTLFLLYLWNVRSLQKAIVGVIQQKVSTQATLFMIFAAYASLSALWATVPSEAVSAGISLVASILACHILLALFARLPVQTLVLIGGWQLVGFTLGFAFLWYELKYGYRVTMWFANTFLGADFDLGSMAFHNKGGKLYYIKHHTANWGVATANVLLWPMVAIAGLVLSGNIRKFAMVTMVVLVGILTYTSDHQTSQIGFPIAAALVTLAHFHARRVVMLLIVGCASLFAFIVPAAQFAFHTLDLDRASWVHPSLQARFIIWGVTADHVPDAPIIGIGAKSTRQWGEQNNVPTVKEEGRAYALTTDAHAHNNYLQIWFELGAIGAALLAAAAISLLNGISKLHPDVAPFAVGMAVIVLTISFVSWSVWNSWLSAIYALGIACVHHANKIASADASTGARASFARIWLPVRRARDATVS